MDKNMDSLNDIIMAEHSRAQADFIADIVIKQPAILGELLEIVFRNEEPVSRRASWPLRIISDRNPQIVEPFVPQIINILPVIDSIPIQRAFLALLVNVDIPEELHGEVLQFTSEVLMDKGSEIAHVIYSTDIFYKLSVNEPDLLNELALMLEQLLPFGSAGVKSKSTRTINKIHKKLGIR